MNVGVPQAGDPAGERGSPSSGGPAGRPGARRANGVLEEEVLAVLQEASEPLTAAEVRDRLGGSLAYTTVVTTLSRLHGKQILSRTPAGRAFAYTPVADASGLTARRMHQVLQDGPDRGRVLSRFVSDLSAGDAALLRTLLETDLGTGDDPGSREGPAHRGG